ncbi:hypothetical protein SAMN05444483_11441 [Salegentibacter echinorum]|uniref:Collagen triple helix repeat-containing protein n=1 Tax=Salegentibacter echinorum TaxID=1073325 RepID=A0A1M5KEJ4_SALEC|nr:hypothetical protein [Salegentibacter echinorum]SHG51030.1 hypothetical protein SAMN05444483_11441 [Salegentibacter echinorum]
MKKLLLILFIFIGFYGNAQVGIGTDMPNPSSQLEIVANDRGVLIPQVPLSGLTDKTTITNGNVESLLVFNTSTTNNIVPGYYYWYNGSWKRIASSDNTNTNIPDNIVIWNSENEEFVYLNKDGDRVNISLNEIANESITTLIDNLDGTYTYTSEDNTVTTINVPADVIGNINNNGIIYEKIINLITSNNFNSSITDNGDGTFTYTNTQGNSTNFDANTTTLVDNGDGTYDLTNADGSTININTNAASNTYDNTNSGLASGNVQDALDEIQQNLEDTSSDFGNIDLTDNGDGTFTFTDGDGNPTNFDANTTTYTNNNDGSYTFTNANGETMTISVVSDVVTNIQNQGDIYNEIINIVGDTSDALVDNDDGTFTHTAMDGTEVTFNANTTSVTETDGVYTFTNPAGNTITTIDTNASALGYDNTNSGLASGNVQDALDEIAGTTGIVSPLSDNGDGSFTYTDESGASTTFDTNNVNVSLASGIYTFNDADGNTITTIDTNASALGYDNTNSGLASGNVQDALDEIQQNLEDTSSDFGNIDLTDNGDGTFTFTDGDGNPTNFDANTTTYTNNNDGSYTFTNANGDSMTVTLVSDVVTNIQNQGDIYNEIINIVGDTSDALVDNGDGTFTHTAMDGTEVTFNANTTSVTETDGVYTFTDPAGNTITTIDTNASALGYDNTNSGLASGNVQDALDEIAGTTGIISPLLDNGDGSFTYTDESGASTTFDTNNVSVSLASGIYTFNDADGNTITTIDTNASAIAFDNSTNQFTANNVQDALEELATLVDTNKGDLTVDGGIEFTGGTDGVNKLLDDMGIQIADGGINTIKLADGAVTAPKLSSGVGAPNQVLTTDGNGNDAQLAWKNIEDFAPAPNFFYMPAVIFETIQTGTGLQRNLYEDYKNQFSGQQFDVAHGASGSSRTYTGGLVGSTGAPSAIHVFESNELYYYITYYDQDVFANLTIDENGVLTYDIINDASPTSYMNIVFVIKNE